MSSDVDNDDDVYNVVINDEEQYSIWWVDRELPLGWKTVGKSGSASVGSVASHFDIPYEV